MRFVFRAGQPCRSLRKHGRLQALQPSARLSGAITIHRGAALRTATMKVLMSWLKAIRQSLAARCLDIEDAAEMYDAIDDGELDPNCVNNEVRHLMNQTET